MPGAIRAPVSSAPATRPGRRVGRIVRSKLFMVLLTASIFAIPALITLNFKHAGEDGIEAQNHLESFVTEMQVQNGIEWQLISGGMTWKDARAELDESREHAQHHLDEAVAEGLLPGEAAHLKELNQIYVRAVDKEVALIGAGKVAEAAELDEAEVDPAFDGTAEDLVMHTAQLEERAESAQRNGDIGILVTVLLSLILVSLVQGLRRRAAVTSKAKLEGEARYRALIDQSADLVLVVDRAGLVSFASPSAERLLAPRCLSDLESRHSQEGQARSAGALEPRPVIDFFAAVDARDREGVLTVLQTATAGTLSTGEFRLDDNHGKTTFEVTVQDLSDDPSVGGLVLTAHDVTRRLAMQREMEHRALHDELTGLPNRALLSDRFARALLMARRNGTRLGLLLLDLERFKEVNDTFGHHYGDELLRQIGPRLTGALRGVDTIARVGGDEFAVLLEDVHGVDEATQVASALLSALSTPFLVEGVNLDVEASIGVVVSGEHGEDAITLMQHADVAMYVAKVQHLGVASYDPSADGHSAAKLAMVGDLRRALDREELVVYYQPKVSLSTGDLVGAEALVRWQHPQKGLVMPDDFIPIAERTGLITPLTQFVLSTAITQARTWLDVGRPLPIAVNLSARNLHDEQLADLIADLLATHHVPASLLELEVTESAIMIDPDRAVRMLEKLSDLGVRLSLDDFGAGYTSLSQLKILPISEIKIDRSFVQSMTEDLRDSLIVQSVISLGHNLGLTLVAEGVEAEQVLTALAGFGCDIVQGYQMSRPITAEAFDIWSAGQCIKPAPPRHVRVPAGDIWSMPDQRPATETWTI